jgi:hypothetical protein
VILVGDVFGGLWYDVKSLSIQMAREFQRCEWWGLAVCLHGPSSITTGIHAQCQSQYFAPDNNMALCIVIVHLTLWHITSGLQVEVYRTEETCLNDDTCLEGPFAVSDSCYNING